MNTASAPLTLKKGPEGAPNFCFGLYDEDDNCETFVQTDWEYASLASRLGWSPALVHGPDPECRHEATDGTVPCPCGVRVDRFLSDAYDWLAARDGETFNPPE